MRKPLISFRIDPEIYLKLESIAAEKGLSPSVYVKERLENEHKNLMTDIQLMQTDLKEIMYAINRLDEDRSNDVEGGGKIIDNQNAVLIEILLILREIAPTQKLSNAQKKLLKTNLKPNNILGI